MFTGIVEQAGTVVSKTETPGGAHLGIQAGVAADGMRLGDSVAVNGVCLTAVSVEGDVIGLDIVPETLQRTNLGGLELGAHVNVERPMPASGRFDGHIVQGHVDATGTVSAIVSEGAGVRLSIEAGPDLMRYIVAKGSITINGVSLTVAAEAGDGFEVALIPHTLEITNLGELEPGSAVNLEVDVIAKYVERIMERRL